jgi:hypothetical protein
MEVRDELIDEIGGDAELASVGVAAAKTVSIDGQDCPLAEMGLPSGLMVPKGVVVTRMRIRASWTMQVGKGDRVLILWPLKVKEEEIALKRSRGDEHRAHNELAKMCVRAIDGRMVVWDGSDPAASIDTVWDEIGPKGRAFVRTWHGRMHSPDDSELEDFLVNCLATATAQ